MRKINEIFYSLQGEGYHTGTPAVFVRFSGCNLHCDFCDTRHENGEWMSDEAMITRLHKAGKRVCIETNGTHPLHAGIDWITCSPKENAPVVLTRMNEVKVVYTGQDVETYTQLPADHFFLQPCSCQNTEAVIDYILAHPHWRLSLQTHKLIHIQ